MTNLIVIIMIMLMIITITMMIMILDMIMVMNKIMNTVMIVIMAMIMLIMTTGARNPKPEAGSRESSERATRKRGPASLPCPASLSVCLPCQHYFIFTPEASQPPCQSANPQKPKKKQKKQKKTVPRQLRQVGG